jgi:NIMA (never in mitosis gene a)-related kinase
MSKYAVQIIKGLKYLSSLKIIHRDIKSANIFIENGVAKIADFGFAQQSEYFIYYLVKNSKILALDHLYICHPKDLFQIYTVQKQMFGH